MKTGILGGTFNPIHIAHLRIAEEVRESCGLDRLLFMPAADPPHKTVDNGVPFERRMAMVEAAIADNPRFAASAIEKQRRGKSFSVDTLEILRREDPDGERYFIIGLDSYRDLTSWKDYARLFELAHIVVTSRPGVDLEEPLEPLPVAVREEFCYASETGEIRHKSGNALIFLSETRLEISSTQIRRKVAHGESIRYLVTPAVADYISRHGLYAGSTQGSH